MSAPSSYRVQQAVSAYQSARARLLAEDPDADVDGTLGAETEDVREILSRLLTAEQTATANAKVLSSMIEDMDVRRHRFTKQKETARATIFAVMDAMETTKAALPHGTISIVAGKPSVVVTDEAALSDRFVTVKRVPNKAEIATALKDGEIVDGAMLSNSLPSVTIRSK